MATTSAAVLSLLTLANALDVARSFPGATVGRGYVHIPVARAPDTAVPADRLRRRSGEQVANLVNGQNTGYLINSMCAADRPLCLEHSLSLENPQP